MNKRLIAIVFCLIVMVVGVVAFTENQKQNRNERIQKTEQSPNTEPQLKNVGQTSVSLVIPSESVDSNQSPTSQQISPNPEAVPPYAVYEGLFRFIDAIRERIEENERQGRDARGWRQYFRRQAGLNEAQDQVLKNVTTNTIQLAKALDIRADAIIRSYRERNGNGRIQPGQTLPPITSELYTLKRQRESLFLQAEQQLRTGLGEDGFQRLQRFLQREITPRVTVINLSEQSSNQTQPSNQ